MKVIIYARVSQDTSGRGRSVEEQEKECRAWAEREGWEVVEVYPEKGSASRFAPRPRSRWAEVLAAIERRDADALLTWEASRHGRDLTGYTELRDACIAAGVKLGYSGTIYDLTTRDARFRTALDSLLAEDEAARTSERVKRAVRANAMAGKVHGKHLYGYRRIYHTRTRALLAIEEHPDQAPIVREIFERMYAGEGTHTIAADLNRRGVPPRRKHRKEGRETAGWTLVAVREVALERPAYAGIREYNGKHLDVEVQWPAIIDRDRWHELRARYAAMPKRRPEEWKVAHLLTGIARCAVCGGSMIVGHQNKGKAVPGQRRVQYKSYVCRGVRAGSSAHVTVAEWALDELVTKVVLSRLSQPDALAQLVEEDDETDARREELQAQIAADSAYLVEVGRRAAEVRDVALLIDQRELVQPRIEAAQAELRRMIKADPLVVRLVSANDVEALWGRYSLEEKRAVIAAVVTPVVHRAERPGQRGRVAERIEWLWVREG